jgi:hypothetical protein
MRRRILLFVLSFVLLGMQHEAQVHFLSHLCSGLARSQETEFVLPHADDACLECALLAAGTSGAIGDQPSVETTSPVTTRPWFAFRSRSADAPIYFSSRAPPVLL